MDGSINCGININNFNAAINGNSLLIQSNSKDVNLKTISVVLKCTVQEELEEIKEMTIDSPDLLP
jgi:hypothetical protein